MISGSEENVHRRTASEHEKLNPAAQTALAMTDLGFFVTPLCWPTSQGKCGCPKHHTDLKEIGKAPLLGEGYEKEKLSRARVIALALKYPHANWGLLLKPSGLLASDADSAEADREVERRGAPPGPRHRTAKGVHRFFRNRSGVIGNTTKRGDSKTLDVLATGYVVLPGSKHQSGVLYESEVSFSEAELEDAPEWMVDLLRESQKAQAEVEALPDDLSPIDLKKLKVPAWVKEVILKGQTSHPKKYPSRSEAVFAVVTALLKAGHDTATIAAILLDPQYAISEKPREQGRKWLAGDIARARAKIQEEKEKMNGHGHASEDPPESDWNGLGDEEENARYTWEERPIEEEELSQPDELAVTPYSEIAERETSWLQYPHLPARSVVSLEGNPGEGKSWVSLAFGSSVSVGRFPFTFSDGRSMAEQEGRDLSEPANVLHINVEDDPEETIKKRLRILGADCSRIFLIQGVHRYLKNGDKVLRFTVDQIPALERTVIKYSARLVILDPIQAYLPKGADMNKAESVRPLMDGLMQMARRTGCTVLIVRHFGKRLTETSLYKAIGSIDFAACVRSVLIVGLYPKEKDTLSLYERGALTHAKSNLAPRGLSLDFELRQDNFSWIGTSTATASDFTGQKPDGKTEEEQGATQEAMEFLREILASGPAERSFIIEQGKKIGMAERTLERASLKLKVKKQRTYKEGKVAGSTWELPAKG